MEQLRGHTAKPHRHLLDPDASVFMIFAEWCVGGDVHPVGVRRHLNGPWIFGRRFVVTIPPAQPGRVSAVAGACGAERSQPATIARTRNSATHGFAKPIWDLCHEHHLKGGKVVVKSHQAAA